MNLFLYKKNGIGNTYLKPYTTLLFSVNEVINFKEVGLHITDRFVVIPFNATFTDNNNNRDINIGEKLCQPLPLQIIATRAVLSFLKVLKNGRFTIPSNVEAETNKYFMECNNVVEFCNLFPITTFISKLRYYEEYRNWCYNNNSQELNNSQFGKYVLALGYGAERYSFKGRRNTYYVNANFDKDRIHNVYVSFDTDQEERLINKSMTFEDYLWNRICNEYIIQNELTLDEESVVQDEEIIFN